MQDTTPTPVVKYGHGNAITTQKDSIEKPSIQSFWALIDREKQLVIQADHFSIPMLFETEAQAAEHKQMNADAGHHFDNVPTRVRILITKDPA